MIPAVNGRKARPASIGEYPRTGWTNSVLKKNIANSPQATTSIATFASADRTHREDARAARGARANASRSHEDREQHRASARIPSTRSRSPSPSHPCTIA